MLSYCLKCRKNTESKNLSCKGVIIRLLSNYAVWNQTIRKKSRFLNEQESSGLLSSLGMKTLWCLWWLLFGFNGINMLIQDIK